MAQFPRKRLSRRSLLALLAGGAAGLVIEACGGGSSSTASPTASRSPSPIATPRPSTPAPTPSPTATPGPSLEEKAGELMLVGFDGATVEKTSIGPTIESGLVGGLVLFANGPFN